eukprot:m.191710 g.191710  ORF g.191710 m.191710 type:complete len:73 (-) comp15151_c0_seq12:54-272(-)
MRLAPHDDRFESLENHLTRDGSPYKLTVWKHLAMNKIFFCTGSIIRQQLRQDRITPRTFLTPALSFGRHFLA